jgi:hypothetical protein
LVGRWEEDYLAEYDWILLGGVKNLKLGLEVIQVWLVKVGCGPNHEKWLEWKKGSMDLM